MDKALPVLQAAHIRSLSWGGRHLASNGLLVRSEVHALFGQSYVTITPEYEFQARRRLKDEFDNGEEYFAMQGLRALAPRGRFEDRPNRRYLEWHNDMVFLR